MRYAYLTLAFAAAFVLSYFGFRGVPFKEAPREVFPEWAFPGMKYQPKYKYQGTSRFFADRRADRPLPAGVVPSAVGPLGRPLQLDSHRYQGRAPGGAFAKGFPAGLGVDRAMMQRGQERYGIYCAPCHGALGDGQGITKLYGMGATPSYHLDRLRQMPEGELFNTITQGKGNMLSYADKLTPEERWAVVAYVRALQRAQNARLEDVPEAQKKELGTP